MTISEQLMKHARIYPIAPDNQVASVRKLESGALEVTQRSGNVFEVAPEDEMFQAFVVWSVLNGGF